MTQDLRTLQWTWSQWCYGEPLLPLTSDLEQVAGEILGNSVTSKDNEMKRRKISKRKRGSFSSSLLGIEILLTEVSSILSLQCWKFHSHF